MKTRTLSALLACAAMVATIAPFGAQAQTGVPLPSKANVPSPQPSPVLPAVPTVAPGYRAPDVAPTSANIIGVTQQPFVGIQLQDAIAMALLKNPNLAVESSNIRVASYQIAEAKAAFGVNFMIEPSVGHSITAPSNAFFAGPGFSNVVQNTQTLEGGFNGTLENGQQFSATLQQQRVDNNTTINSFNPTYNTALNLSLTQPLLRNAGMNGLKREYKLSIVNADSNTASTLADVSTTISQVEDDYWDLVSAWRNVAIQEDALRQSLAQQQSNVRLARRGSAAPIDAVESATQVATYQNDVFSALQNVASLQNQLKAAIVDSAGDPIWRANLVPTSSVLELPNISDLNHLIADAMAHRPEVREAADLTEQANINLAYAKNQRLPQADIQAQYTSNGLAGYLQPVPPALQPFIGTATPPPTTQGGMAQSYNNLWNFRFPSYNVGLVISQPLGNVGARAQVGAAQEQEHQAAVQTAGVAQRISFEARNALQAYQSALARLYSTRRAREDAEAVYASELRKFKNGESTTFLVLQRQLTLYQSRGSELQAQTDLNKAVVELQRVDGSILSINNVSIQTLGSGALK